VGYREKEREGGKKKSQEYSHRIAKKRGKEKRGEMGEICLLFKKAGQTDLHALRRGKRKGLKTTLCRVGEKEKGKGGPQFLWPTERSFWEWQERKNWGGGDAALDGEKEEEGFRQRKSPSSLLREEEEKGMEGDCKGLGKKNGDDWTFRVGKKPAFHKGKGERATGRRWKWDVSDSMSVPKKGERLARQVRRRKAVRNQKKGRGGEPERSGRVGSGSSHLLGGRG